MFKPNFKYTNKMVKKIAEISAAREIIFNSPLVPKWEVTLRKDAIIRSAHSSTSIEGNRLSLEQVSELAKGREIMASRKDKKEVLNYLNVLEKLDELIKNNQIKISDILKIHKMVTKNTLENSDDCGKFRNRYVIVENRRTGEVIFYPPKNKEVPGMVHDLTNWINSQVVTEYEPVIEAGIVHYEFVRIHPFIDGNGRTARVLSALILYLRGFDTKRFFCLDDYYNFERQEYYKALQSVNPNTLDITKWLEYFVDGVHLSINSVKEQVIKLSSEKLRAKKKQVALTDRQMKIIEYIIKNEKIANKEIRKMFKISDRAALKEIRKLVDLEVVKSNGKGRNLYYVMV